MTKIHGSTDCGNSPKNTFVQAVAVSIEAGEIALDLLSPDVIWQGAKGAPIKGASAVRDEIAGRTKPKAIVVEHAISHGKVGAANGQTTLPNGVTHRFSHMFEFTTARGNCVAAIKSYA